MRRWLRATVHGGPPGHPSGGWLALDLARNNLGGGSSVGTSPHTPGTYPYYCQAHGFTGSVVVE
jgi:plastocyanin